MVHALLVWLNESPCKRCECRVGDMIGTMVSAEANAAGGNSRLSEHFVAWVDVADTLQPVLMVKDRLTGLMGSVGQDLVVGIVGVVTCVGDVKGCDDGRFNVCGDRACDNSGRTDHGALVEGEVRGVKSGCGLLGKDNLQ